MWCIDCIALFVTLKSSVSVAAAQAHAKAEAACTQASYAKREIDMQVEKAHIEATLNALKEEYEAEAASAQAQVFETAVGLEDYNLVNKASRAQSQKQSIQRIGEYIQAQFTSSQNHTSTHVDEGTEVTLIMQPRHLPNIQDHCVSHNITSHHITLK